MRRQNDKKITPRNSAVPKPRVTHKTIIFVLLLLLLPVGYKTFQTVQSAEAFIPTNKKATPLTIKLGTSHEKITIDAITQFLFLHFNISPPSATMNKAMQEIADANAAVDIDQFHSEKHFDAENFVGGQHRLVNLGGRIKTLLDFNLIDIARSRLGEALHTLQDFYSHSNWIELYGVGMISQDLGRPNGILIELSPGIPTCVDCTSAPPCLGILVGNSLFNCDNNLIQPSPGLTSGYFAGITTGPEDIVKPNQNKCSHGGIEDTSSLPLVGTGINKDSLDCGLSPHHALHQDAVIAATLATMQFIRDLKDYYGVTDHQLGILLGVGPDMTVVMDTTGSMSAVNQQVKQQATQIVNNRIGTSEEPSKYILVPFNDQQAGPAEVTTDPNVFKINISGLTSSGTVDTPELQNTAMYQAVSVTDPGGDVFMFTCGTSKDGNLSSSVSSLARSKDIHIYPTVFDCSGTVWAWGANGFGELGTGLADFTTHFTPAPVTGTDGMGHLGPLSHVRTVSGGYQHILAATTDGASWAWGWNANGQAGVPPDNGSLSYVPLALPTPGLGNVVAVSAGGAHSLALKSDGTVWAWGSNGVGQLGNSVINSNFGYITSSPVQVVSPSDPTGKLTAVVAIAAGYAHSLAVKSDGTVWAWGRSDSGQLGIDPCTVSGAVLTPLQVPGVSGVVAVAAGDLFSLALKNDGEVWAWGDASSGELGNGKIANSSLSCVTPGFPFPLSGYSFTPPVQSGVSGVVEISTSAPSFTSLARTSDGAVWAWGRNDYGQLGIDPAAFSTSSTPSPVPGVSGMVAVAGGTYHSMALKSDGTVWAWGANGNGLLGVDPNLTSCIVGTDKNGIPISQSCRPVPGQVPGLSGVVAIAAGSFNSLAVVVSPQNSAAGAQGTAQAKYAVSPSIAISSGSVTPLIDPSYVSATADSGGQLFSLTPSEAGNITTLADLLVRSNSVDLLSITDSAGSLAKTYTVPADSMITTLNFVVSGSVSMTVQRPDGSTVLATDPGVRVLSLSNGTILSVASPIAGNWIANVNGSGSFSFKASGESTLSLSHFRFVEPGGRPGHEGYFPIAGLPVANQPVVADAVVDGPFTAANTGSCSINFDLRGTDGSAIASLSLSPVPDGPIGECAGSFTLPNAPFLIYATGTDTNGNAFQRAISSPTQAQTITVSRPDPQELTPTQQTTYVFTVRNFGAADTFTVTATDDSQYITSVTLTSFSLANNGTQNVTVTLQPGANVRGGNSDTLTVTVQSSTVPTLKNFAVVSSFVNPSSTSVADATPPVTTAAPSPGPNANGWNNKNVTVTLNSTDSEPNGTGVKQIAYSASGAQTIASTVVTGSSTSFTISTEGITTISFFGTDNAGNIEAAKTITIKIDKTPPSIIGSRTPPPNQNDWNNTNVTVSFSCSDSLSGMAPGSAPANTVLSTEAAGQSVLGTCTDLAGNSATATVVNINIDKTPPVLTVTSLPLPNSNGWNNTDVTVSFAAVDTLSGVAVVSPPVTITTEGAGQVVTGSATDMAGNLAVGKVIVNVDKTPPEAFIQFDPVSKDVVLFGRDSLSGVAPGAVTPISVQSPPKGDEDRDDKDKDPEKRDDKKPRDSDGPKVEIRTYKVFDLAGNSLVLAEKVRKAEHRISARILSLQYNGGAVIPLPRNQESFEWEAAMDGSLKELQEEFKSGRGKEDQRVEAEFSARANKTIIRQEKPEPKTKVVKVGLDLLRMITAGRKLVIEF